MWRIRSNKGTRPVPVLIPEDAREALMYIASQRARNTKVPMENKYLFPNSVMGYARAYDSLKRICAECDLGDPSRITSVAMRKYTATLTQMLNLDSYQIQWVCNHLGHSTNVHKTHYRQMSGFVERVHMSKLFLLQDLNLTHKFQGKNLQDIDISEILFQNLEGLQEEVQTEVQALPDECILNNYEPKEDEVFQHMDSDEDAEDSSLDVSLEHTASTTMPLKKCHKHPRQRWNDVECAELNKFFKTYLESGITPRCKAVESAKRKSKKGGGQIWMWPNDKIIKKISALNHKK